MTLATSKRNKGLPSPADARKVPVEKGRQSEHVTYLHDAKEKPLVSMATVKEFQPYSLLPRYSFLIIP